MELIDRAPDITVDEDALEQLREQAGTARTLTLITDNCGEIVMDKILLRQLLSMNPDLLITVIRSPTTRHWRTRSRSALQSLDIA